MLPCSPSYPWAPMGAALLPPASRYASRGEVWRVRWLLKLMEKRNTAIKCKQLVTLPKKSADCSATCVNMPGGKCTTGMSNSCSPHATTLPWGSRRHNGNIPLSFTGVDSWRCHYSARSFLRQIPQGRSCFTPTALHTFTYQRHSFLLGHSSWLRMSRQFTKQCALSTIY